MWADAPTEQVAQIDPYEAALTASELWASGIERRRLYAGDAQSNECDETASGQRALLLTFGRCPKELEEAILKSQLVVRLAARGVDVRPIWARGANILVEGAERLDLEIPLAGEGWKPWHVLVWEEDEPALSEALQALPYSYRKLKPQRGRQELPDDLSLLDVSSSSHPEIDCGSDAPVPSYSSLANDVSNMIQVKYTFIHIAPSHDTRTTRSF